MTISLATKGLRKLIMPMVLRLLRCERPDQNWLTNLGLFYPGFAGSSLANDNEAAFSEAIMMNIVVAEMVQRPLQRTVQYWVDRVKTYPPFWNLNASALFTEQVNIVGEQYYREPLATQFSQYQGPLLILSGTLDPQTPPSFAVPWKNHYTAPNQYFLSFDSCVHGVVWFSNMKSSPQTSCGYLTMMNFIRQPKSFVPPSCINTDMEDVPFDFARITPEALLITQYGNLWTGGPAYSLIEKASIISILIVFLVLSCCAAMCLLTLAWVLVFAKSCCCAQRQRQQYMQH
jgi:hypothetical protein